MRYLVMDLPHSDDCYPQAFPAEATEIVPEGHVRVFAYGAAVRMRILHDNTALAVARILGDGRRQRTRAFSELENHYLFADKFGRPGKGNDSGGEEGLRSGDVHFNVVFGLGAMRGQVATIAISAMDGAAHDEDAIQLMEGRGILLNERVDIAVGGGQWRSA